MLCRKCSSNTSQSKGITSSNPNGNHERPYNTRTWVSHLQTWETRFETDANTLRIATAVSRIDNLEFLSDVIPKTTTYKQFKEKKAKEGPVKSGGIEKGQRTLNGTKSSKSKSLKPKVNGDSMDQDRPSTEEPLRNSGAPITLVVDRTVEGGSKEQERDVEMTDQ